MEMDIQQTKTITTKTRTPRVSRSPFGDKITEFYGKPNITGVVLERKPKLIPADCHIIDKTVKWGEDISFQGKSNPSGKTYKQISRPVAGKDEDYRKHILSLYENKLQEMLTGQTALDMDGIEDRLFGKEYQTDLIIKTVQRWVRNNCVMIFDEESGLKFYYFRWVDE